MYNSWYMMTFMRYEKVKQEDLQIAAFLIQLAFLLVKNEKCFKGVFVREEDGVRYLRHDCWRMERMSDEDAALVKEIAEFVKGCGKERLEAFIRWLIRDFCDGEEICIELLAFDLNERWERQEEERLFDEVRKTINKDRFTIREVRELIERLRESVMKGLTYEGGRKYWLEELEKRRKERDRLKEIVRESNERVKNQLRN